MKLPKSLEIKCDQAAEKYASDNSSFRDCSLCNGKEVGLEQGYQAGYAQCFTDAAQLSQPLVEAITRRMKSDDACGHPFDENLGDALAEYKKSLAIE